MKEIKTRRYIIYWHKMANSGIWGYEDLAQTKDVAKSLTNQEGMFDVVIIDTKDQVLLVYKGEK